MAANVYMKRGDTSPPIEKTLTGADDLPADLNDINAVTFFMRPFRGKREDAVVLGGTTDVVGDPTEGNVKYTWADGDTDVAGIYFGEFEVIYVDDSRETFPNATYIVIQVTDDIGDGGTS